MRMIHAFQALVAEARDRDYDLINFETPHVDFEHLESMLDRIKADPTAFSDAKLGRWLGYAQGVLVANGCMTLDEMKDLNRRFAED